MNRFLPVEKLKGMWGIIDMKGPISKSITYYSTNGPKLLAKEWHEYSKHIRKHQQARHYSAASLHSPLQDNLWFHFLLN